MTAMPHHRELVVAGTEGADSFGVQRFEDEIWVTSFPRDTIGGPGCVTYDDPGMPAMAQCTVGNDAVAAELNGGAGHDKMQVWGGLTSATWDGGPGDDVMTGGTEPDEFAWEPGNDRYVAGPEDTLSYAAAPSAVTVSLNDEIPDGIAGEIDDVRGIGTLTGSAFSDRLTVPTAGATHSVTVDGRDGNDALTTAAPGTLIGGDGDDGLAARGRPVELIGGAGRDTLTGGPEADWLDPGTGNDDVDGGAGDDTLVAAGDAAGSLRDGDDIFRGGSGEDHMSYASRDATSSAGVSVSLDGTANDGSPGERDNVAADVETLTGSDGPDVLLGSPRADLIHGGSGDDAIDGLAGADTISGGGGSDRINATDGAEDRVNCDGQPANASDTVTADPVDLLFNCEAITLLPPVPQAAGDVAGPTFTLGRRPAAMTRRRFAGDGVAFRVTSSEIARLEVTLTAPLRLRNGRLTFATTKVGDITLGTAKAQISRTTRTVRVKPRLALRPTLRRRAVTATVRLRATDAAGNVTTRTVKVRTR